MPIPWKKVRLSGGGGGGISRLVSAVRSKHRAASSSSPLVVQTGFPTSLADLVVKNRSRLKTPSMSSLSPSSRKNHRRHNRHPSPPPPAHVPHSGYRADSFVSRVSEIITAVQTTSSRSHSTAVSDDDEIAESDEKPNFSPARLREAPPGSGEPVLLSPVEENYNFLSLPDRQPPVDTEKSRLLSPSPEKVAIPFTYPGRKGVSFQAKVILLLILAVCSKELVLVITASALALLLLEYVGSHLLPLLGSGKDSNAIPAPATRAILDSHTKPNNNLNLLTGTEGVSFQSDTTRRLSNSVSFRWEQSSASSSASDKKGAILVEGKGPSGTERMKEESMNTKVKKKHWIKVVTGKFRAAKRGAKRVKDSTSDCSDASSRGTSTMRVGEEQAEGFGEVEETCDIECDDRYDGDIILISQNPDETAGVGINSSDCIGLDLNEVRKSSGRNSSHLVLVTVVLSGLIGGRIAALGLTVACCYLLKFSGILPRRRDFQQVL